MVGEVALANREHERALALANKTLEGMRLIRARLFLPDLYYLRGRVLVEIGEVEEGYNGFLDAYREAKAQLSRRSHWPILVALSELESKLGEADAAESRRQEAQEVIAFIADHIDDSRLRGAFLNLPRVREIEQSPFLDLRLHKTPESSRKATEKVCYGKTDHSDRR